MRNQNPSPGGRLKLCTISISYQGVLKNGHTSYNPQIVRQFYGYAALPNYFATPDFTRHLGIRIRCNHLYELLDCRGVIRKSLYTHPEQWNEKTFSFLPPGEGLFLRPDHYSFVSAEAV